MTKDTKQITDLQKQIEELTFLSAQLLEKNLSDTEYWLIKGEMETAKKALSIIKQLQEEVERYKVLWETSSEGARVIIAEQEEEIKQLKEKLNDK